MLTIHNMLVLSTIKYGETVYSSALQSILQTLEAVHNKGIRIALGAFCVTKTEKLLAEAQAIPLHTQRKISARKLKFSATSYKLQATSCKLQEV
jgi:hypothetical protein